MENTTSVIAVFTDHHLAETAIKKLAAADFDIKNISIVGKGYRTDEKVVGFYTSRDRMTFWGTQGAMWGGLWGMFFGGLYLTIPPIGGVVILGGLAAILVSAIENAIVVGGLSVLGAGFYSLGVPKDSIVNYETTLKADGFLVMAHGTMAEVERAKVILAASQAVRIDIHANAAPEMAGVRDAHAAG